MGTRVSPQVASSRSRGKLEAAIDGAEVQRALAVAQAIAEITQDRDRVLSELAEAKKEVVTAIELADAKAVGELAKTRAAKDAEIADLTARLDKAGAEQKLALSAAVAVVEKERDKLQNELAAKSTEIVLAEKSLKERYEAPLKDREEEIGRLKDLKAKLSSSGTKGDFVFRDYDESGTEIVSIMFEMKNESDTTATKHKNEDFLAKLDKDRREKGCEYAVLVSLLEADSDLYNTGIVDVSHRYAKTFVVRPQFFLTLIALLRNAALGALTYKRELEAVRQQNIDVTNFETQLAEFKDRFGRNWRLASEGFDEAIHRIDEAIKDLERTKAALHKCANNLRLANDKAEDLTIKRLTRGNPTMTARFAEIERAQDDAAGTGDESDAA